MNIRAIPTTHNGVQMRSKLEAQIATTLDRLGVRWLYEVEGYDIEGVWYLPDFWLPDLKVFVEVKGVLDESCQKPMRLAEALEGRGIPVFLVMPGSCIEMYGRNRRKVDLEDGLLELQQRAHHPADSSSGEADWRSPFVEHFKALDALREERVRVYGPEVYAGRHDLTRWLMDWGYDRHTVRRIEEAEARRAAAARVDARPSFRRGEPYESFVARYAAAGPRSDGVIVTCAACKRVGPRNHLVGWYHYKLCDEDGNEHLQYVCTRCYW